jgi:hypothetical protein
MVKLSGKRTVSGQFPGKPRCGTDGAILGYKKKLSGQKTGKCNDSSRAMHNPVFLVYGFILIKGPGRQRQEERVLLNNTLIISNNKLVNENLSTHVEVLFSEMTLLETMEKARDLIHKGYKLLTHPLSGSIKPNDTPYKSIALEKRLGPVDFKSLEIMEQSIARTRSLLEQRAVPDWPEECLKDFRAIDLDLIRNALRI